MDGQDPLVQGLTQAITRSLIDRPFREDEMLAACQVVGSIDKLQRQEKGKTSLLMTWTEEFMNIVLKGVSQGSVSNILNNFSSNWPEGLQDPNVFGQIEVALSLTLQGLPLHCKEGTEEESLCYLLKHLLQGSLSSPPGSDNDPMVMKVPPMAMARTKSNVKAAFADHLKRLAGKIYINLVSKANILQ